MFGIPRVCCCSGGVRLAAPARPHTSLAAHTPAYRHHRNRMCRVKSYSGNNLEVNPDGGMLDDEIIINKEQDPLGKEAEELGAELLGITPEELASKTLIVKELEAPATQEDLGLEMGDDEEEEEEEEVQIAEREEQSDGVPFKVGDDVVGIVVWSSERGCKVSISGTVIDGWCMARDFPHRVVVGDEDVGNLFPRDGFMREFRVVQIPPNCQPHGKGPLLSARAYDKDMLYKRIRQISRVCSDELEVVPALCTGVNKGGLRAVSCGAYAFLPRSLCWKDSYRFYSDEELGEKYCNKTIAVTVVSSDALKNRVVLSEVKARENQVLSNVQPGYLVWGKVKSMEEWGVFITIDDTSVSGLLHISNISQAGIDSVDSLFAIGDRVCCVIISMEEHFKRIALSTADLEENPGDMLVDKEKVYEHAPIAVAQIQKEIDAQRADYSEE